mgnify:CR=1 FL=1
MKTRLHRRPRLALWLTCLALGLSCQRSGTAPMVSELEGCDDLTLAAPLADGPTYVCSLDATGSPGVIITDMTRDFLTPAVQERVLPRFPLGRLTTVDDVAAMALFLASDAAAFVTGQTVAVDGGFLTS